MLCYVDDSLPGVSRKKLAQGWAWYDPAGKRITDRAEIDRLAAIGMPPAYRDCWFCPSPLGHMQATGYDARGRKQYRYHADFRSDADDSKYQLCAAFGRALPLIRARVESDLATVTLDKQTVVAGVVRLLDLGRVRIGNEAYARANKSYGATTLRKKHADIRRRRLKLEYRGKSGKMQRLSIEDARLARLARRCQDLGGQHLFQYLDDAGDPHPVSSSDVNAYIAEAMGANFTAKHFRTWGASVIAFAALASAGKAGISLKAILDVVAASLGNTPAISRKSYVHPLLIDIAKGDESLDGLRLPRATRYLSRAERGLLALLEEREPQSLEQSRTI